MDFFGIAFYDEDKNYINRAYLTQNNKITSQILSNSKYVRVFINKSGLILNGNSFEQYELQLEYNITPSTYVPHKEQTFTFPLGNEKLMLGDYLADDGIHHVRGQVVFDGLETWNMSITSRFYITVNNIKSNFNTGMCNKFVKQTLQAQNGITFAPSNTKNIYIYYSNKTTVNDFKNWLTEQYNNNSPVIVEYELNEEVIVPYTSAQQEVYNQIKQAISYEEQTNISSNQNALFSVEAYQSTKLILQNIDSRLTLVEG